MKTALVMSASVVRVINLTQDIYKAELYVRLYERMIADSPMDTQMHGCSSPSIDENICVHIQMFYKLCYSVKTQM